MSARPPRVARWIIALAAARHDRDALVDDLEELYAIRRAQTDAARADRWYWRQVFTSVPHLVARRLERGTATPSNGSAMGLEPERQPEAFASITYILRHAVRRLLREPAFTLAAVLTLALGVGGNLAVFAVVEAVLLRPLPYPASDRLLIVNHRDSRTGITKEFVPIADYQEMLVRQSTFDIFGTYGSGPATVYGSGDPYRARMFAATDGALAALGVRPSLGRLFEASDLRQGAAPVVILGYEYWRDKMGADPKVVGQSIRINQTTRTIVGVSPPNFTFRATRPAELIFPMVLPPQSPSRRGGFTFVIARLKPGKTVADGVADLAKMSRQLEQEFPQSNLAASYFALPLRDALVGNTKSALVLLLAAVGVVLLVACVNVANLLLARSLSRRREMAVRLALGAGRGRLALQLLSESFVLAVVASVAGIVIAIWGSRALVALVPESVQAPGLTDVHINGAVLGFALGLTMLTTLAFGLLGMLTVKLDSTAAVLVGAGRTSASGGVRRTATSLVVAEVALAVMLLIGAGLVVRTFSGLLSVDPGFRYENVMTTSISLPAERYRDTLSREGFYRSAVASLRAVPGVADVGMAAVTPLTGNNWTVPFERADQPVPAGERAPEVGWQVASAGFFRALGIPVIAGRLPDERDRPGGPTVVVVSEALQKRFYPNEGAVGKQIRLGNATGEIIGVVGNIRRAGLRDDPRPDMYFPFEQSPQTQTTLFVSTRSDPARLFPSMQAAIKGVEAKTVFMESRSLADVAAESVRTTKLILWLLGAFAASALLLAAIGIYGVMSYVVRQRTREIGTRIALGATRIDILWLIMRQGAAIAVCGAAIGILAGVGAARSLKSVLFGVSASDPITMTTASLVLVGAVLAACYVPARRAAAVDPARTLAEQ